MPCCCCPSSSSSATLSAVPYAQCGVWRLRAAVQLGNSNPCLALASAATAAECLTPIRQNKTPCSPFLNDPLFASSPPLCVSKLLDSPSPPRIHNHTLIVSTLSSLLRKTHRQSRVYQCRPLYLDRPTSLGSWRVSAHGRLERAAITFAFLAVTSHCPQAFVVARIPHHNKHSRSTHITRVPLLMCTAMPSPTLSSSPHANLS